MTASVQAEQDEWDGWIRDWLLAETDRQQPLAVKTVEVYSRGVRQFVDWLAEHDPGVTGPGGVTARHVGGWLGHLARTGRGESTRRVRLMTLRAFFGWVVTEPGSPLTTNPAAAMAAPVVELPAIRVCPTTTCAPSSPHATPARSSTGATPPFCGCSLDQNGACP